jgi:hypothetical protein
MSQVLFSNPAEEAIARQWKPFKKQQDFLKVPFSIFEVLYGGAAGGGKSDAAVIMPLYYGFHLQPNYKGITLRRTLPDLEQEIINRSHQWYAPAGGRYIEKKKRWVFPSGAMEVFGHAEHKEDIRRYDSVEYNKACFEEATHFLEFQYLYFIASRVRTADSSLPAIVRNTSNPGNVGHAFFRRRFVDPDPAGYKIIKDLRTGQKRIYIPAKLTDNDILMASDPLYIRRLELLPEAEKRAKLYGDWYTFEGQVFIDFRPDGPFPGEPENANHVIPPFEVPEWWPKIATIDWGHQAQTILHVLAVAPDQRVYVIAELAFEKTLISTWGTEIGKFLDSFKNVIKVKLDANAFSSQGEPLTIAEQFQSYSGYTPEPADKGKGSRVSGKILLQEYLRWTPRPARKIIFGEFNELVAERILRNLGTEKYYDYLNLFAPEPEEGDIPKLQIFNTCKRLIECIPLCIYDPDNVEDVKEFNGDDPYDNIRYGLREIERYKTASVAKWKEIQALNKIVKNLEKDGNMTRFYRQMEKMEAANEEIGAVQRWTRRRVA